MNHIKNDDFDDRAATARDEFSAQQRLRTIFEFIANENLKGVLQVEIGDMRWGHPGQGGAIGTDGINWETKHAFINFKVPNTEVDVRAGLQAVALPSTLGSHILDADVGALVASMPLSDMASLTLGWARALDAADADAPPVFRNDELDVFLAVLPLKLEGAELNPFVAVAHWSARSNPYGAFVPPAGVVDDGVANATLWHMGLNFEVAALEPITILGDLNYGSVEWNPTLEQAGWVGVLAAQYAMDMVTPQLFGVYESGEGRNIAGLAPPVVPVTESERMPVINTAGGAFGPGVGLGQQTAFAQSNFLRPVLDGLDPVLPGQSAEGAIGLWALGAALRDIQFADKFSHELVAFFARGTNDRVNTWLFTTEDSYWEMNFNTRYQMYENLALILELAYADVNLDALDARNVGVDRAALADDAMTRAVLGLLYRF
jgi:hypothetical protein